MSHGDAALLEQRYQQAREYVGHIQRVHLGAVRSRDFQRFAVAVGDLAPEYFEEKAARDAGHPGLISPLMYLSAVLGWEAGPVESELLPDGNAQEPFCSVRLDGLRLMGGGQQLKFFHPVVSDMDVTMEVKVEDIKLKEGRQGTMILLVVGRRYFDVQGRLLVECSETFIAR